MKHGTRIPRCCSAALAIVIGFALITAAEVRAEPATEPNPDLSLVAEAPLDTTTNWPLVEVVVNGHGPYWFIVDSGAMGTVLREELVRELELPTVGRAHVKSPLGPGGYDADLVAIDVLEIGGSWRTATQAVSMADEYLPIPHREIRGILGFPLFRDLLLTLDYPEGRLTLHRGRLPDPDGEEVLEMRPAPEGRPLPSITLQVGSLDLDATIDTGNSHGLSLPTALADKLKLESAPVKTKSVELVGTVVEIREAVLDGSLSIGATSIDRPTLYFGDFRNANVGFGILRRFAITFDQSNGRVRFREGAPVDGAQETAHPRFSSRKRYGVRFYGLTGDTIEVVGVDSGSPAAAAGVEAGDVIIAINGARIETLSPQQRASALRSSPISLDYRRGSEVGRLEMSLDD